MANILRQNHMSETIMEMNICNSRRGTSQHIRLQMQLFCMWVTVHWFSYSEHKRSGRYRESHFCSCNKVIAALKTLHRIHILRVSKYLHPTAATESPLGPSKSSQPWANVQHHTPSVIRCILLHTCYCSINISRLYNLWQIPLFRSSRIRVEFSLPLI